MKLNIGNIADGDGYFERPYLNVKFWRLLTKSGHLSIPAPRRVGKTSFMINLVAEGKEGYKIVYIITESIDDSNEFFRKIYKELLNVLSSTKKFAEHLDDVYKKLDIKKISLSGIEFGKNDIDFFEEIKYLLKKIKEKDNHIVLLIDEFSQTLENIILYKGNSEAKLFLHRCRELRIDPVCKDKISFVYTGSVGLENLVASIDEAKSISDIGRFEMTTLTDEETIQLINKILNNEDFDFPLEAKKYLIQKTKWLLPYFIQIIMSEIEEICIATNTNKIDTETIDAAFINALSNRSYFEHWLTRLRVMFKGKDLNCIKEMLNNTAKHNFQTKYEYYDVATKFEIEDVSTFINMLVHDGYIVKPEGEDKYRFNSPLLQEWWIRNIVN